MEPAFSIPDAIAPAAADSALAVIDLSGGRRLTYGALRELAARAAAWLTQALGDPMGERVAYVGRNGIELLALALGAERCGTIFVPLNWRLAAPELGGLVADCRPRLVIAQAEFAGLLSGATDSADVLAAIEATETQRASPTLDPDRAIILLYTSGTSGTPKGVVVTARNAQVAAENFRAVGQVDARSTAFSDLPMFHTIGLIAVARATLASGGTLVLSDRFQPARTLQVLGDRGLGVTHYFAVPVMARALLREPGFEPRHLEGLRAIFVGGAPLDPDLVDEYLGIGTLLVNGYGMSEAGTAIHVPISREAVQQSAGAVGLPAPQMEIRLTGPDGSDVDLGDVGEIWLRGPAVTPGYWNRASETKAAFSQGWFRTGDLARREPNGFYRIVDRLKDMYVSGGENVYPAEVEAALLRCSGVADAAVVGVPDARWGESGVAFVVMQAGTMFDPAKLQSGCATQLARYKCPSHIVAVAAIPRSAAGKILKPLLRAQLNRGDAQ